MPLWLRDCSRHHDVPRRDVRGNSPTDVHSSWLHTSPVDVTPRPTLSRVGRDTGRAARRSPWTIITAFPEASCPHTVTSNRRKTLVFCISAFCQCNMQATHTQVSSTCAIKGLSAVLYTEEKPSFPIAFLHRKCRQKRNVLSPMSPAHVHLHASCPVCIAGMLPTEYAAQPPTRGNAQETMNKKQKWAGSSAGKI